MSLPALGTIPVVGTCRCSAIDANAALLMHDLALLHGYTDPVMLPKGTDYPTGSDPDFDATWASVPTSVQSSKPSTPASVLVYFHGYNGFSTANAANPSGAAPHWWLKGPHRPYPSPTPNRSKKDAAGPRYELDKALGLDPIVLVPEVGIPKHDPKRIKGVPQPGTYDGHVAKDGLGRLSPPGTGLETFIDDALTHLRLLSTPIAPGGTGPTLEYLPTGIDLTVMKRFFLTGHSGGGVPLSQAAASALALSRPTDLMLLDCTYGSGTKEYVNFVSTWNTAGKLGRGAGNSRMVVVWIQGSDTEAQAQDIRSQLRTSVKLSYTGPITLNPAKPPASWPTTDMLEIAFNSASPSTPPKPLLDLTLSALGSGTIGSLAPGNFKVVFINVNIAHDNIPCVFIPLLCGSSTVP